MAIKIDFFAATKKTSSIAFASKKPVANYTNIKLQRER
jgi:hypothetical protein